MPQEPRYSQYVAPALPLFARPLIDDVPRHFSSWKTELPPLKSAPVVVAEIEPTVVIAAPAPARVVEFPRPRVESTERIHPAFALRRGA